MAERVETSEGALSERQVAERQVAERQVGAEAPHPADPAAGSAWRVRRAAPPAPVREEARRLERIEQLLRSDRQS